MEEKTRFSADELQIEPLTEGDSQSLSDFYCGNEKLDKFLRDDIFRCARIKYLKPYKCVIKANGKIAGVVTLANDLLELSFEDKCDWYNEAEEGADIIESIASFPALNIAHLAIRREYQSCGIGRILVSMIIASFSKNSPAGCQFITVDAINNPRTISFYEDKLHFEPRDSNLFTADNPEITRRFYFNLAMLK